MEIGTSQHHGLTGDNPNPLGGWMGPGGNPNQNRGGQGGGQGSGSYAEEYTKIFLATGGRFQQANVGWTPGDWLDAAAEWSERNQKGLLNGLSIAVGFIPVVGDCLDLIGAITGVDPITGEPLSARERLISLAAAAIPFVSGKVLKEIAGKADEVADLAKKDLADLGRKNGKQFDDTWDASRKQCSDGTIQCFLGESLILSAQDDPGYDVGAETAAIPAETDASNAWLFPAILVGIGLAGYRELSLHARRKRTEEEEREAMDLLFAEDPDEPFPWRFQTPMNNDTQTALARRTDWKGTTTDCTEDTDWKAAVSGLPLCEFEGLESQSSRWESREASASYPSGVGFSPSAFDPIPRGVGFSPRSVATQTSVRTTRSSASANSKPRAPSGRHKGGLWLATCCLLAALVFGFSSRSFRDSNVAASARTRGNVAAVARTRETHRPDRKIEDLRVGMRVLARNPDSNEIERAAPTKVDPATWRLIRLQSIERWQDGTLDDMNIETLQPLSVIEELGLVVCKTMAAPLEGEELYRSSEIEGTIVAIEPCPEIESGPGHVVLTTLNHLNRDLYEFKLQDSAGRIEKLNPTGLHRLYSEDRKEWTPAEWLEVGEQLRGVDGPLQVISKKQLPGVHRVYNLTVEGEHVFFVSPLGILSHNNNTQLPGVPCYVDPNAPPGGKTVEDFRPEAERRMAETKAKYPEAEGKKAMAKKQDIKDIDRIAKEEGLTEGQRELLHDEISHQGISLDEIREVAKDMKELYPNK